MHLLQDLQNRTPLITVPPGATDSTNFHEFTGMQRVLLAFGGVWWRFRAMVQRQELPGAEVPWIPVFPGICVSSIAFFAFHEHNLQTA